jgi:hypothetical protein
MATLGRRLATVIERVDLPDCVEEPAGPITRLPNVRSRRNLAVAAHSGEGQLTQPTAGVQPWLRERVFMPLSGRSDQ